MLAEEDAYIKDASKTIFELCADLEVKKRCWEREEFEDYAERLAKAEVELAQKNAELSEKDTELLKKDVTLSEKSAALGKAEAEAKKYREWAIAHGYKDD